MTRLAVVAHLTVDELDRRYRRARDPVARSQWQIVWLVAQGQSGRAAATATGYSTKWVGTVVRRYNADGPAGIGDRRHANPGRAPVLSSEQQAALHARLASPPPDGGLWSGPKVAAWIAEQTGQAVGPQCGWEYLVRLGCTLRRPRPRHAQADPAAQAGFKKGGLAAEVAAVERAHPDARVTVWATDEHRVGLKPVLRRVWVRPGDRPVAVVHHRYQWLWLVAFVHPVTGANHWYLLPRIRTDTFSLALAEFATAVGAGPAHRVVLVLDQAGWHVSAALAVPDGLHLVFLPPYSPELQPTERLWPLSNEPIANRAVADLDELEDILAARCVTLMADRATVRRHAHFHWWPVTCHDQELLTAS